MAEKQANYDEDLVPQYELPEPLTCEDGTAVDSVHAWQERRRPEILELFRDQVYGRTPAATPELVKVRLLEGPAPALGGAAVREQVGVEFAGAGARAAMQILLYLPAGGRGPAPVFLGLNFFGNHTVQDDPAILLSTAWMRDDPKQGVVGNRATEASRGASTSRWSVDRLVARGYGLATVYCGDLDPDFDDGFQNGVHPLFYGPGQSRPAADQWGTIGAWAWGLSRALDWLEAHAGVDRRRVAVMGHSRLGKTALWAGAQDARFALVISNDSGCGGAALSRRCYGETVGRITRTFPHWFCGNFAAYAEREAELPVDQHELIALMAPRPVYVASAAEDHWADPRGEFLATYHAGPVYRLFGHDGLPGPEMPGLEEPHLTRAGYHLRRGGHDVTPYDWDRYMDMADRHLPAVT